MKTFVVGCLLIFLTGFYSLAKLNFHPFLSIDTKIEVLVHYQGEDFSVFVEPYSTLETVLSLLPLEEDVDFTKINQKQIVHHQEKFVLPLINPDKGCVSINFANAETLMTLTGVGPVMAQRIVEHRHQKGAFKTLEALMDVKGIGKKTYEKLVGSLCL